VLPNAQAGAAETSSLPEARRALIVESP
jgi:hypothetical protein